jgi:ADP-heptose:LPS heptosyltransferase
MIRNDCVHFRGDKPCRFKRVCEDCPHFEAIGPKVLVIKCRAQGDVLRTTPLLPGLRRKHPGSAISWVVDPESVELLENNPYLHRVLPFNLETVLPLQVEEFDAVYGLDKEPALAGLATQVRGVRKYGFGLTKDGALMIFNEAAAYAYRLGIDDDLKFRRNEKTYQQIAAEAAEVDYRGEEYVFELRDEARAKAAAFFKARRISGRRPAVGLNTGAGTKFVTKQWPVPSYRKLIRLLTGKLGADVFLLGGPREKAMNESLARGAGPRVYNTGSGNTLLEFAGFIDRLNVVVTSDTLGMHIAIALKKKVVALFGPTCPQEIDLYGRGVKLFAGAGCAPCYKQTCPDPVCMKGLSVERVFEEIRKLL